MRSLLLSTFLLLSLVSFSQTRDEIIYRHNGGMKKTVITYSGLGNSEKIVKTSEYNSDFLVPYRVDTYGSKIEGGKNRWVIVKTEYFKNGGSTEDKVYNY